jgi:hypothetical protein
LKPFDWVGANVDNDGSERARAWKDGGANDICPVGFNVPTNLELKNEINKAGISNRLGERTVLYLNPLKFIVPLVESEGSEGSEGSLAVETLNFVLKQRLLRLLQVLKLLILTVL